jgi:hypothetical protein
MVHKKYKDIEYEFGSKKYIFKYYPFCLKPGISVLTDKRWDVGTAIFWCKALQHGFTLEDVMGSELLEEDIDHVYRGPTDSNITYDDSESRNITKKLFKDKFNLDLIDHPGKYIKLPTGEYILETDGQFCVDLMWKNSTQNNIIYVEVERSDFYPNYDLNSPLTVHIVSDKFEKYFMDNVGNKTYYMCFISTTYKKACVIHGKDIKKCNKAYKCQDIKNEYGKKVGFKNVMEIDKTYCKIFDLYNYI